MRSFPFTTSRRNTMSIQFHGVARAVNLTVATHTSSSPEQGRPSLFSITPGELCSLIACSLIERTVVAPVRVFGTLRNTAFPFEDHEASNGQPVGSKSRKGLAGRLMATAAV